MTESARGAAESTARGSATVAIWTLGSRITGMLRVLLIGAVLGPTYFGNIFQAGYVLPNTVFAVVAGPVLAMVVVPTVASAVAKSGVARAAEVFGHVAGRLLAVAALASVFLALISPLLAWTLVLGVPDAEHGRAWLLCTVLILFVAPQVFLYTVAELGVAAQQGRHRFALAAGAPIVESLGTIATLFVAAALFGGDHEVSDVPMAMVVFLGVGNTIAVVVHAALQCYGAIRVGIPIRPRRGWRTDREASASLRRMVHSIPVAGGPALVDYGLTVIASTVPGGVLVLQISIQVFSALAFVGSRAVSMAALPGLSEAAAAGDPKRFGAAWRQGVFYALAAGIPLLMLLAVFAHPTADLLANGDLRDALLITELAACLCVAAFAQLANGLHDYTRQALFARLDERGPTQASIAVVIASALVALAALPFTGGPRLVILVGALLVGELAGWVTALRRLRAAMRAEPVDPGPLADRRQMVTLLIGTVGMVPFLIAGLWVSSGFHDRLVLLPILVGCGLVALLPFGLALRLRGLRGASSQAVRA
jgi:putative peptidoglycan lipid II flippase